MREATRRMFSVLVVLALVIGMLPIFPANAATVAITIVDTAYLYSPKEGETNYEAKIPRLTTNPIQIVVNLPNFDMSQLDNLYYEIYNETTKTSTVEKYNKATQTGDFQATFNNVTLTEGLNRVTVILDGANTIASPPAYAYFTAVSNITDLKLDTDLFVEGEILPTEPKQRFMISGTASNATEVRAYVNNEQIPHYAQMNRGKFYFVAEDETLPPSLQQTTFLLRPGNNSILFEARNGTNSYFTKRNFIYDNGKPFAYDVTIQELDISQNPVSGSLKLPLIDLESYTPTQDSNLVLLEAKLKVNHAAGNNYNKVEFLSRGSVIESIDLSTLTVEKSTPDYKVYKYSRVVNLGPDRNQLLEFKFIHEDTTTYVMTSFPFVYNSPNIPYVDYVKRNVNTADGVRLSDTEVNVITEVPITLTAYVRNADSIHVYLGTSTTPMDSSKVVPSPSEADAYIIDLSELSDGVTTVRIVPVKGGVESTSGAKSYRLNITIVPYFIINNIYDGMVVRNGASDFVCGNTPRCISGRVVNLPANYKATLSLNGAILSDLTINSDGTFQYTFPVATDLTEGSNTLKFDLRINNQLVTSTSFEIFFIAQDAPQFTSIVLQSRYGTDKFVKAQRDDMYVTNESYVRFVGKYTNETASIAITVRKKDENGNPHVSYDRIAAPIKDNLGTDAASIYKRTGNTISSNDVDMDPDSYNNDNDKPLYIWTADDPTVNSIDPGFVTNWIKLMPEGDTVIEFTITNSSGITVTRTITITREPLPYRIISPVLVETSPGKAQANVNSNYVEIRIEAEGADAVLFGKEAANKDTSITTSDVFVYEKRNLKDGNNRTKFTIVRGDQEIDGELNIYYTNTPVVGAQYKTTFSTKMSVFGGKVELQFPRGTMLTRNVSGDTNAPITDTRQILFGIADGTDGRVDKYKHPKPSEYNPNNPNPINPAVENGQFLLMEDTGRFRPASELFWIDAGTIMDRNSYDSEEVYLDEVLNGSGRLPYDNVVFFNRNSNDLVVPTEQGTLTLKYDPNIVQDAWRYVTVMYFDTYVDYRGIPVSRWRNIGGVVNIKDNTITVPFEKFGYYRVMYMDNSFDDVTNHPWARNDLDTVYSKGIMNAYSSYSFMPNVEITRGEFVTLLVKIFELPLNYEGEGTFNDVFQIDPFSNGLYEYKYIETAARAGIVRGTTGNTFMPSASITRQDAALMIARAAELKMESDMSKSLANLQEVFTDANQIDTYALPAVEAVVEAKLMEGKENGLLTGSDEVTYRFDPLETMTRAEAATIAMRVLAQQGKVPK